MASSPVHIRNGLKAGGILLAAGAIFVAGLGIGWHWPMAAPFRANAVLQPRYPDDPAWRLAASLRPKNFLQPNRVPGLVVNHHLLASSFIADTLTAASEQPIRRVIIISPNHFLTGHGVAISSAADWRTPIGRLPTDRQAVKTLVAAGVSLEDEPISQEHGVFNILPFINSVFPRAAIVPLMIKEGTTDQRLARLRQALQPLLTRDTLVIGSFDFSHYQTSAVADEHDHASLAAVENFDLGAIDHLDIDSRPGLKLLLMLMPGEGATRFQLLHHSNSAKLTNQPNATSTTSYITGLFTRP